MVDFLQMRIQTDVPKRMVPTVAFTARQCPVCQKWAHILVRPSYAELQSEICDDFCQGRAKYPSAYVSFQGSCIENGHAIIETLKGNDGAPGVPGPSGRNGKDASPPTREELRSLLQEILDEEKARGFWRKFLRLRKA
jgi:hypothetical protein